MHNINRGFYRGCAPGGIRTPNLLIRSQMLYPLSYGRMMKFSLRLNVTPLPPISQITWLQPLLPEQPQFW